jgi:CubicO group peptidase (beta-lactamase class C family)
MKLPRFLYFFLGVLALAATARAQTPTSDSLDAYVRGLMARRHIPGVSLAIIQGGQIVYAKGYGVVDSSRAPVTTATLFQAGSISKPVSALGALHLVEAGRLSLDGNVNDKLTSWRVPDNAFTTTEKVTLRRILSHNAGVTVHGFPGYDISDSVPTLVQVLDGTGPANTTAIRVDTTPGAIWRYSGGGFTILQQMIVDVTGMPFPRFMQRTVLGPIGMTLSSFDQPQPRARAALTAAGYYANRKPVRGRWHVYPEMAAAGLWTTPTDLARFAIEIQKTLAGDGHGVISPAMARQYVTVQKAPSGLGIIVQDTGKIMSFTHGGRDEGFDAQLIAFATTGQGAAIMINANDNSRFFGRVLGFVGRMYGWPTTGLAGTPPAVVQAAVVDSGLLATYAGWYELQENQMISLVPSGARTGLETLTDGFPDETFLAIDSLRFGSDERSVRIAFAKDSAGAVTGLVWRLGEGSPGERIVGRVVPLPSTRTPVADPDSALSMRTLAAVRALDHGGSALASAPDIPPRTKADFSGGTGALDGLTPPIYLGDEDVSGRGIHRHGSDVARVRYYRVSTKAGPGYLLVHLTAQGSVADYDLVDR